MKRLLISVFACATTSAFGIDVVAHRGEPNLAPENTLESIKLAYKIGSKCVETDLNWTKSGEIVIVHGRPELKSLWGIDKDPSEITPKDREKSKLVHPQWKSCFASKIPTISEVLKCVPKDGKLECEIKIYSPEFAKAFDDARKAAGVEVSQIYIIGFNKEYLADFKSKYPDYKITYICYASKKGKAVTTPAEIIEAAKFAGAKDVALGGYKAIDREFVDALKAAGLVVHVWCADTEEDLAKAAELGADAITTNRADYLKKNLPYFKSVKRVELK